MRVGGRPLVFEMELLHPDPPPPPEPRRSRARDTCRGQSLFWRSRLAARCAAARRLYTPCGTERTTILFFSLPSALLKLHQCAWREGLKGWGGMHVQLDKQTREHCHAAQKRASVDVRESISTRFSCQFCNNERTHPTSHHAWRRSMFKCQSPRRCRWLIGTARRDSSSQCAD